MSDPKFDSRVAAAEAKAAKAKAKALRPWYKKKRIIIPAVIVLLAVGRGVMGGSSDTKSSTSSDSSNSSSDSSSQTKALPGIGEVVTDGSIAFKVTDVSCGHKSVGDDMLGKNAQGQFCIVSLAIKNAGNEAATMFADNQKLYDADGREFSPDTEAGLYLDPKASVLWDQINPGNTLQGRIVYDVPAGVSLDKIELHESMYSTGVSVSLH